jgi:PIN domain nuclease of toxin-antitoxin system
MRLLLDTQVALWWLLGAKRLAGTARRQIAAASCVVSAASVWEIAIKHRLAKLPVAPRTFRDAMLDAGASILPVSDDHAIASAEIVLAHDDPFDRLLTAVAREEGLRLVTGDARLLDAPRANPGLSVLEV